MTISFDGELLLAGGGDAVDSWQLDEWLVEEIGQDATMGYIPVAMPPGRYPDCEEWITGVFAEHGLSDIRVWTDLGAIGASDMAAVNAVYIGGGNTYRLVDELRETSTVPLLREFIAAGGRLYGGSAGAIICGESIETTPDENRVGVTDTTGLQLLPETDIWCHYTDSDDAAIKKYMAQTGRSVVAIPERSGVSITDVRARVIGHVPISVFSEKGKTIREPDDQFSLESGHQ